MCVLFGTTCSQTQAKKMTSPNLAQLSSPSSSSNLSVESSRFHHTPSYCEENVYFLCKRLSADGLANSDCSDLFVIFISNEKKQVPLWHQKASQRADGIVLWDYHVICIQKRKDGNCSPLVWDLDSSLSFPSPLASYIAETIRPSFPLFSEFKRFFRIVHAPLFLRFFASDRRHMKDAAGNWIAQPPPYDAVVAEDGVVHNLNEYMDITSADVKNLEADPIKSIDTQKLGVVVSENQLEEFFFLISYR